MIGAYHWHGVRNGESRLSTSSVRPHWDERACIGLRRARRPIDPLGERRMAKEIKKLSGHTIVCVCVCGYGRVGRTLTQKLCKAGVDIVVIDSDPAKIIEAEADAPVG